MIVNARHRFPAQTRHTGELGQMDDWPDGTRIDVIALAVGMALALFGAWLICKGLGLL